MHFLADSACMTQVTVRRVEEAWVAKAKAEAAERGVSMNQVLVDALQRGLGVVAQKKTNGLEQFAGSMPFESEAERIAWDEAMKDCERIDEESWK
jgi:hypothetical protein